MLPKATYKICYSEKYVCLLRTHPELNYKNVTFRFLFYMWNQCVIAVLKNLKKKKQDNKNITFVTHSSWTLKAFTAFKV